MAKKGRQPTAANRRQPTAADQAAFQQKFGATPIDRGVSMKRDNDGVYVHTHRARSKSFPSADKIPKKVVDFIESTG